MGLNQVFSKMDWPYLLSLVLSVIPALICITIHEMCHGFAAYKLGDRTAATQGRLSLNPLRHLDPLGLLMLVLFHFGWAKPVSVDMRNFKHPKRDMAITALAGPVSNIVLASVVLFFYGLFYKMLAGSPLGKQAIQLLIQTAYLSVCLGVFNLIPIPPLDGSKVLFAILPNNMYNLLMRYERYGFILLTVLVVFTNVLNAPINTVSTAVYNWLSPIATFAYNLMK